MVELHDAEVLAHHMESCLRAIRKGNVELNAANLETLLAGSNALEAVIVARRRGLPAPSGEPVIAALRNLATAHADTTRYSRVPLPIGHPPMNRCGLYTSCLDPSWSSVASRSTRFGRGC